MSKANMEKNSIFKVIFCSFTNPYTLSFISLEILKLIVSPLKV